MRSTSGYGLAESVVVVAVLGLALMIALPTATEMRSTLSVAAGARSLAVNLGELRWSSVAQAASHGLLFDSDDRGWSWVTVRDGNGNGLRSKEVASGVDPILSGPHRLEDLVSSVRLGFPRQGTYPRIPPSTGVVVATDDPIRIGNTNLLSFAPTGGSTSGTLYVTDGRRLYAVVLFGRTGRVRVWRFDEEEAEWKS